MNAKEFASGLIAHATNYVGLVEIEQNSRWSKPALSASLLEFMRRVPWWAPGAAYCAAFDGAMVCQTLEAAQSDPQPFLKVWTAHCMTNVRKMREMALLSAAPVKGALWLARHGSTDSGHAGIVTDLSGDSMATIEGNTSAGRAGSQRNGDGIYARSRNIRQNGDLRTQGFVHPGAVLKICGLAERPPIEPPAPEEKPDDAMVPIYGILRASGYSDASAVAAIKSQKIQGQQYDAAAQMSVAPLESIKQFLK